MPHSYYENGSVDIAGRLKRYKIKKELTYEQLAQELGVDKSSVVRWCSGSYAHLRASTQKRLYELLDVDLEREADVYYKKPIFPHEHVGEDLGTMKDCLETVVVDGAEDKRGDYFLKIDGTASEDFYIPPTSLVYVKETDHVDNGQLAVVRIGETAAIKRYFEKNGIILLESGSSNIPTRVYTLQEAESIPVQVVGEVVSVRIDFAKLQKRTDAQRAEGFCFD